MTRPAVVADRDRRQARERAQRRIRVELVTGMVRKDLKIRYQGSVLGFAWSLANPLMLLAIYWFAFGVVMKSGVPDFPIFIACGLLPWTAFSSAIASATGSVVSNAGLVKKVRFPLEVLPLSAVGYALLHFALQFLAIFGVAMAFHRVLSPALLLVVPATLLLITFTCALSYLTAALNVRYRDTTHLVEVALLVWFWLTPVVYPASLIKDRLGDHFWLYFVNPMATVVACFQRGIYVTDHYVDRFSGSPGQVLADPGWGFYATHLAVGFVVAGVLLVLTRRLFLRWQGNFVEEL